MINIVIPMAGKGQRFYDLGYDTPKPLIEINGYPFFYYAVKSFTLYYEYSSLIFVGLREHDKNNSLTNTIKKFFPDAKIKLLDETPPGAVLTSREAIELIDNDFPVVFNDCDHAFYSEELRLSQNQFNSLDGFLLTFNSSKPCYSYCIKDEKGRIIGTKEKEVVSSDAIAGVYGFKNMKLFDEASKVYLNECKYSEFFLSGVYNTDQLKNGLVKNYESDFNISFGTVDEFLRVKDSRLFDFFNGSLPK